MRVFITLHLEFSEDNPPAMRQQVVAALALIDLHSKIDGHKGSVTLPHNCFAGIRNWQVDALRPLQAWRRQLIDECSRILAPLGFRCSFFLNLSRQSCWGYRPVPRRPKYVAGGSDLGSNDLDELFLPERNAATAVTQPLSTDD